MKLTARLIIEHAALVLLILMAWLIALCTIAKAQEADPRPILRVWSSPTCGPCRQFWHDFQSDGTFRAAIEARFRVVHVAADAEPPKTRQRYGVNGLPTFESGLSINVLGYCGRNDLLERLQITRPSPATVPAPVADLSVLESRLDTLSTALEQLQIDQHQKEQILVDAIGRNSGELAAISSWIRTQPDPPDVDAHAEELNTLRQRVDDLLDRLSTPASTQPSPAPVPTIARSDPTDAPSQPGAFLGWLIGMGLTLTQAAGVGGSIATGGGIGIAWAAVKLYASWRRRSRASDGVTTTIPGPTSFAAYPVDRLSEAYNWAKRELAAKYPGSVAALETLDSLVQQHLAATATNPQARR